jgi:RHS repeat-associated protein
MKKSILSAMAFILFILMGFQSLFAGNVTFFGPRQYTRDKAKPVTEIDTFPCPANYTGTGFTLRLVNGDARGESRVSSAVININGVQVMGPADFNQQAGISERTISLTGNNEISVKLNSKPGAYVTIDIFKFIPEPVVTFSAAPDTIQYKQFSTLSWQVDHADTITIDNGIGNVQSSGSVRVSPEILVTTYTLTAVNLGGTTGKQVTVTVIFPVPTVTFAASPVIIRTGVVSTLTWATFAAHTVTIEPGIGGVELNGSRAVSPAATTTYIITAVGYGGTQTAAAAVTIDNIPPQVNISQPQDGAFINSTTVWVKGEVADTSPVSLKVNNSDVPLGENNNFEVPLQLPEGSHIINLTALDSAGNQSNVAIHLTIDTTAPQLTITSPGNNALVREIPVEITGTLVETNPLKVVLNNTLEGNISGNAFTFNNVSLNVGENQLMVTALDKAGNTGLAAVIVTYIPDSEPPGITIISPQEGIFQNTPEVLVTGTITDQSAIAYVRVNGQDVQLNGQAYTHKILLKEGENTILVESEDEYQNKGSASVKVTLDTAQPLITVSQPVPGSYFNISQVMVKGQVDDTSPVTLEVNGVDVGLQGNMFETGLELVEGVNPILVEAQDAAGNSRSHELQVFCDITLPTMAITSPGNNTVTSLDTITLTGSITDKNPFKVRVTGGSAGSEGKDGEIVGNYFYFRDMVLQEGENTFEFFVHDRAGNTNQTQYTLTVIRDKTLPQLTIQSPVPGALLSQRTVLVKGTVFDVHLKDIKINNYTCEIQDNTFNYVLTLVEGSNTITIAAADTAGNIKNETLAVMVDTAGPVVNISAPASDAVLNSPTVTVSGRADDMHLAAVKINGQAASLSGNQFTLADVPLQEGSNTITVEAVDSAGNTTSASIIVTLDTAAPAIIGVMPADQAAGVPLDTKIRVEFSEPIAPSTLTPQTFYLNKSFTGVQGAVLQKSPLAAGGEINGTMTIQGSQVIFTPVGLLPDSSQVFLHVTTGIHDPAGNALQAPYSGSFFTMDTTAPAAPQVNPLPGRTALKSLTLSGMGESHAQIAVTGGLYSVETSCDEQGNFSLVVALKQDQLNQLCVTAGDAAGNQSIPACSPVYQENAEFAVTRADFQDNRVEVAFSKPIDPSTLTAATFVVSSANGIETGTLSTAAGGMEAWFSPAADLSAQTIMVEVTTGIMDSEGTPLSYPFTAVFNQQGGEVIVQGEVYDDSTGLPLGGAFVKLVVLDGTPSPEPAPSTITTPEGKYVLVIPAGQCVLRISRNGYTQSYRLAAAAAGFSSAVFDARLAPLNPGTVSISSEGGTVSAGNESGTLVFPEGALDVEKTVCFTAVGPQALPSRLPPGWSPLAAFDLRLSGGELGKPCQLHLPLPPAARGSFEKPPLDPAKLFSNLLEPGLLILGYWDDFSFQWKAVSGVAASPQELSASLDKTGFYAFLIKDITPVSPPQPIIGQPIAGVPQGTIPGADQISASLAFTPTAIYPGDTASAELTITSVTPFSSGVPVQADISENYELLTGSKAVFAPYTADLTAYNYGTGTTTVVFNVSPNSRISIKELKIGTIKTDMIRYTAGTTGVVVGPDGGIVSGDGGSEISFPAGAVANPTAVTIKKIEAAEITAALPAGFELIGAIDLSLSGTSLLKPAVLSLQLTQEQMDNLPTEAQLIAVHLEKLDALLSMNWILKSQAAVETQASRISTFIDPGAGLPFPGVTQGGTYLFLRALSPLGFFTGTVTENTQPVTGAILSAANHDIKALTSSNYVQAAFTGSVELTALDPVTRNQGIGSGNLQEAGQVIPLNIAIQPTGPAITQITPADNTTGVPLNSKIIFIFTEPVHAASFNAQTVYISAAAANVPGQFKLSTDSKQGEFVPHAEFPSDTIINITVTTGLTDLQGNPMSQVFTSSFRTVDIVPPEADLTRISIAMPENGSTTVTGAPGAVEPGSMVTVFNERTGETAAATGLSDGSFSVTIAAEISDRLKITVIDPAGNEILLPHKPYVSADGRQVVLDSSANEFITPEGLGIKVEEGTFSSPVKVGLYEETNPANLAPTSQGYQSLKALRVDFGGIEPDKPFKLSITAPPGITDTSELFAAYQVELFGKKRWMVVDSTSLINNRIQTNTPPWPGCRKEGVYNYVINLEAEIAYVCSSAPSASSAVMGFDMVFLPGYGKSTVNSWVMPIRTGQDVTITIRDTVTGETLYESTTPALTMKGQVYDFGTLKNENDKELPMITRAPDLQILCFAVVPQQVASLGITVDAEDSDNNGMIDSIKIEGDKGTSVVIDTTDPDADQTPGKIRLFKLVKTGTGQEETKKMEEITTFNANPDGSFSGSETANTGDKFVITVEKGNIPLNREFIISFSEPLKEYNQDDLPVSIKEEGKEEELELESEILETGTDIRIRPAVQFEEDTRYVLKIDNLEDRSENALSLACNFRTKKSSRISYYREMDFVYDTILYGSYLLVAAGRDGLKILDVSNPGDIKEISHPYRFPGLLRGLALYKDNLLVAVGGGELNNGVVKIIDISDIENPLQLKSQIITDSMTSDYSTLPSGYPYHVQVLDNYAFVTVLGTGLVVVDLEKMTPTSPQNKEAILLWHEQELLIETGVYQDIDPQTQQSRIIAVLLVDNFGLKLLDVTRTASPLELGSYMMPVQGFHLNSLMVVHDYWVDIDKDGLKDQDEDEDDDETTADMEKKDLAFFNVSGTQKLFIIDITDPQSPQKYGTILIEDSRSFGDLFLDEKNRTLYINEMNLGLVVVDVDFSGKTLEGDGSDRVLSTAKNYGTSRFGLVVDTELNLAYVGKATQGVDIIKLDNPQLKLVYKEGEVYKEVVQIAPSGIKPADNPQMYPDTIYVMAFLPGGIGNTVKADLWALNDEGVPINNWGDKIRAYEELILTRQSDDPREEKYNMFLSEPVVITIDPGDTSTGKKMMSGYFIQVNFSVEDNPNLVKLAYLKESDLAMCLDRKPSLISESIDSEKPNPVNNSSLGRGEVSLAGQGLNANSSSYSSVYLHSGEFFLEETDLVIPGRGFDFIFNRKYESQSIYSGPLGWGWDHNYNRRLLFLYNGDILYYDGSGRVERYKAKKNVSGVISGFESPKGYFTEMTRLQDGTFIIKHPDGFMEIFDAIGKLILLEDSNNNKMYFYYNYGGQLSTIVDTMGRVYTLAYYPYDKNDKKSNRLMSITDFTGSGISYEYDDYGDLEQVVYKNRKRIYKYTTSGDIKMAHNLISVTDAKNQKYLEVTYSDDKATKVKYGDNTVNISSGEFASTTDGNGNSREYTHDNDGHPLTITEGGFTTTYTYNDDGLIQSVKYPGGNNTQYTYDSSNSNRRSKGNLQKETHAPGLETTYVYENYTNQVTAITDPNGNKTVFAVNDKGNRTGITYPDGTSVQFEFNDLGQLTKEIDPQGKITGYTYYPETGPGGNGTASAGGRVLDGNSGGYLKQIVKDKGGDNISQTFEYNSLGSIKVQKDGEGVNTLFTYNDYSEIVEIIGGASPSSDGQPALNDTTTFTRDDNGNILTKTNKKIVTTYTYDILGRPLTMQKTAGSLTKNYGFTYDNAGNLEEITDPRGNKDTFTYDERSLLKTKSLGNGITTLQYEYTPNGKLYKLTDCEGKIYTYNYDDHDRLMEIIDPLGNKVNYTFDNNSNILSVQEVGADGASKLIESEYNNLNQMTNQKIQTELGQIITQYGYNASGQMNSVTDSHNNITTIERTGSGLVNKLTDPMGNEEKYAYDKRGGIKQFTKTESRGKSITFNVVDDVLGKITNLNDTMQREWRYVYDEDEYLKTTSDPDNNIVSFEYDAFGRQTKRIRRIDYNGETTGLDETIYTYDANDNLIKVTDAKGNETNCTYDAKDRLIKVTYPDETFEMVTYNCSDRILTETDRCGSVVTNTYDDAGRLIRKDIQKADGVEGTSYEEFTYDGLNRLVKAENEDSVVTFEYNTEGKIIKERLQINDLGGDPPVVPMIYDITSEYDLHGNRKFVYYPSLLSVNSRFDLHNRISDIYSPSKNFISYTYEGKDKITRKELYSNAITMTYTFDNADRPTEVSFKHNDDLLFKEVIGWTKTDLRKFEDIGDQYKKKIEYEYDSIFRLRKVTDPIAKKETEYSMDTVENIHEITETFQSIFKKLYTRQYNNLHQITKLGYTALSYDKNGNLKEYKHKYVYDWKNQLVKIIMNDTDSIEFKYDALGRRIQQIVTIDEEKQIKNFIYDGWRIIEERDGDGNLTARYVHGRGLDELVAFDIDTDNDGDLESFIPLQDTKGSVIAVADETGKVIEVIRYSTYGAPTFHYKKESPQKKIFILDVDLKPPLIDVVRVISGKIFIRFSESMDKVNLENNITLKKGTDSLSGTFSYADEDRVVCFEPDNQLPQDQNLIITVTTELMDLSGNHLENEMNQNFTYPGEDVVVYDRKAPEVVSAKCISGLFYVEFDEEIDPNSVENSMELTSNQGTFGGAVVPQSLKVLKFTPEYNISFGVKYTLKVKTIIRDISGKGLAEEFTKSFIYVGDDLLIYIKSSNDPQSTSLTGINYLFQGREYIPEAGIYYYRARYYHPELARFLQTDPMGYNDSMNLYQSFNQNPVNFTDPMGKEPLGDKIYAWWKRRIFLARESWSTRDDPISSVLGGTLTELGSPVGEMFNAGNRIGEVYVREGGFDSFESGLLIVAQSMGELGNIILTVTPVSAVAKSSKVAIMKVKYKIHYRGNPKLGNVKYKGWYGEYASGISEVQKTSIPSLTGSASRRIPDDLNNLMKNALGEVKYVKNLSYTKQIEDFYLYSQKMEMKFILLTRSNTKLSSKLLELKDNKDIIQKIIRNIKPIEIFGFGVWQLNYKSQYDL